MQLVSVFVLFVCWTRYEIAKSEYSIIYHEGWLFTLQKSQSCSLLSYLIWFYFQRLRYNQSQTRCKDPRQYAISAMEFSSRIVNQKIRNGTMARKCPWKIQKRFFPKYTIAIQTKIQSGKPNRTTRNNKKISVCLARLSSFPEHQENDVQFANENSSYLNQNF